MHLHNKSVLISPVETEITESLKNYGINVEFSACIKELLSFERYHADMQLLRIKERTFVPANVEDLITTISKYSEDLCVCRALEADYPENVCLNAVLIGDNLLCKVNALAEEVREYCLKNDIKLIDVNQGYAKCSTLVVNSKAIITADATIGKAASDLSIDVLRIRQGYITLDDKNDGFIGGASGVIGNTVMFFGDINTHPDAHIIKEFLKKYKMNYISLCKGFLKDIGGFVLIN